MDAASKVAPIISSGLQPYIENIATDFYSAYHRWSPNKPVDWRFRQLQARAKYSPNDQSIFIRKPSLSDVKALAAIKKRLTHIVRIYARYHPLYFNLGDESGIADLSAAWDFDISRPSVDQMRVWLKHQYKTLGALNREWDTSYSTWNSVMPATTTETMKRADGNYAAWSDFKQWMDVAFARAVSAGTLAVHSGGKRCRSAIEGAQIAGWGGYDYALLAPAVDVMELYDADQNLALAQSFNPSLITLSTSHWSGPDAVRRAWQELLRGTRGMIIWDPNNLFVRRDGALGPNGRRALPFLRQLQRGIGPLIIASQRVRSPVAILYSPESFRIDWMLSHRKIGEKWTQLSAESENSSNMVRSARKEAWRALSRLGITPYFVSDQQVADGQLTSAKCKVLVLAGSIALSHDAYVAIRRFMNAGGRLVVIGEVARYDGHGRRLKHSQLKHLLNVQASHILSLPIDIRPSQALLSALLRGAGVVGASELSPKSQMVEQYVFHRSSVTLVALLSAAAVRPGQRKRPVFINLPHESYVYDVGKRRLLGRLRRVRLGIRSSSPTVIALSDKLLSRKGCRVALLWADCPAFVGRSNVLKRAQ